MVMVARCDKKRYSYVKSVRMHVKVSDIIAGEVGDSVSLIITEERPSLPDLILKQGINGVIGLTKTSFGLLTRGSIEAEIELECHRCLQTYPFSKTVKLVAEYGLRPEDEQWPIAQDETIDLAPLVRQELLVNLPIKQICRSDCLGLCADCGQVQQQLHHHQSVDRTTNWRVKQKGLSHGST